MGRRNITTLSINRVDVNDRGYGVALRRVQVQRARVPPKHFVGGIEDDRRRFLGRHQMVQSLSECSELSIGGFGSLELGGIFLERCASSPQLIQLANKLRLGFGFATHHLLLEPKHAEVGNRSEEHTSELQSLAYL